MSLSPLPAEIHELIIDSIAACPPLDRRNALSICSQVCKLWHSSSLRHTFYDVELPRHLKRRREVNILRLMETNSEIARCIKSVSIVFPSIEEISTYDDDEFEQVCRAVSKCVSQLAFYRAVPDLRSRPLVQNGLFLLLGSPNLSHLSFVSAFKSSLLETVVSQSLKSLSFNHVKDVVLDHEDSAKLSRSLQKVKLWGSETVISTMQQTPGLSQIFERSQYFHIIVDPGSLRSTTLWDHDLIWGNCTSVDLTFGFFFELNQEFFSYCDDFPWSSLSALKRLKISVFLTEIGSPVGAEASAATPWIAEASKARLFLSGPSRLRTLEDLQLKYHLVMLFKSDARVEQTLRELFRDSLEPNFRRGDTFPSLGTFDLCVNMTGTPGLSGGGTVKETVKMDIEKCLPSIFGLGGRCETDGWVARVDVDWYSLLQVVRNITCIH